ncbi:Sphingomyelin phosphodiesterase [Entamoeba marina]
MDNGAIVLKAVIVGESGVGKTTICNDITNGDFQTTSPTVGAEFVTFNKKFNNKMVTVHMWDTSGQERFHSISRSFYRNAKAAIVVYDISRKKTFEKLDYWITDIKNNSDDVVMICVGNKVDLEREVTIEEARAFAIKHELVYTETSAKTLEGIDDMIKEMFAKVFEEGCEAEEITANDKLKIEDSTSQQSNEYCC